MTVNKVSALFMILAITLSIAGFTYAHWKDSIQITGTVKMAHIKMTIGSYKILPDSNITPELSADNHTLTLTCDGLQPCWFVWIGLVTQNEGTLPAWVKPPVYTYEDPYGLKQYFENKTYFYGPYPESTGFGNLEVWKGSPPPVNVGGELLSNGTVTFSTNSTTPPFIADPGEKVVIWIWLHVRPNIDDDAQGKSIIININIVDDIAI